jgi:hypothetical protein
MRPLHPPLPAALSKHYLLRISRCLPPVWRNAAPAPPASPLFPSSALASLLFSCTKRRVRRRARPGRALLGAPQARHVLHHPRRPPRRASRSAAGGREGAGFPLEPAHLGLCGPRAVGRRYPRVQGDADAGRRCRQVHVPVRSAVLRNCRRSGD